MQCKIQTSTCTLHLIIINCQRCFSFAVSHFLHFLDPSLPSTFIRSLRVRFWLMWEMAEVLQRGRSLAETPTYSVASVITVMVFVCFLVERSIYRFGKVRGKNIIVKTLSYFEKQRIAIFSSLQLSAWLLGKYGKWNIIIVVSFIIWGTNS